MEWSFILIIEAKEMLYFSTLFR